MQMATLLSSLKPYTYNQTIKARAARVWTTTNNGQPTSFNCIFVDSQGGAIQASAKAKDVPLFLTKIKDGGFYEVANFYTSESSTINPIVNNEAIIDLKQNVKIKPLHAALPNTQRYFFTLTDFSVIPTRGRNSRLLIDVLARVKAIQPIQTITVQNSRLESIREIIIENIRNEDLRVTLWGDVAKRFDEDAIHALQPPVVIVFAGFKAAEFLGKPVLNSTAASVWYLNPDIPEVLSYKHFFASVPNEIQQLALPYRSTHTIQEQKRHNRKTIKEILCTNPHTHKGDHFTCRASITDYDVHLGWWYNRCPHCTRSLQQNTAQLKCPTHGPIDTPPIPWFKLDCIVTDGSDVTDFIMIGKTAENFFGNSAHYYVTDMKFKDPRKIPPPLTKKLQKTHIFQLRFGAFRSANNRCDIMVTNVFNDDSDNEAADNEQNNTNQDQTTESSSTLGEIANQIYLPPTPAIKDTQTTIIPLTMPPTIPMAHDSYHPTVLQQPKRKLHFIATATQEPAKKHQHDDIDTHTPTRSPFDKGKAISEELP